MSTNLRYSYSSNTEQNTIVYTFIIILSSSCDSRTLLIKDYLSQVCNKDKLLDDMSRNFWHFSTYWQVLKKNNLKTKTTTIVEPLYTSWVPLGLEGIWWPRTSVILICRNRTELISQINDIEPLNTKFDNDFLAC